MANASKAKFLGLWVGVAAVIGFALFLQAQKSREAVKRAQPESQTPSHGLVAEPSSTPSVGSWKENDSVTLPFLGPIPCRSREERFTHLDKDGRLATFAMKCFYSKNGQFIRAEYHKPKGEDWELPPETMKLQYEGLGQQIVGLPAHPGRIPLRTLLDRVNEMQLGPYWEATKLSISYVLLSEMFQKPRRPVYIVHIYGTVLMNPDIMPDREEFKRARMIVDENNPIIIMDTCL